MHAYPTIDAVFDVNYDDPNLAKENYLKYQGIVDRMAESAEDGVEFRMCNNAMPAAGFEADDMHGFITVVPAGFPGIALLQHQGYTFINPIPLPVRDVPYLDQPARKPESVTRAKEGLNNAILALPDRAKRKA